MAVTVAEGVKAIPDGVSHVLACNCKAIEPCKRGNCSCKSLKTSCTEFCVCNANAYHNEWTSDKTLLYELEYDAEEGYGKRENKLCKVEQLLLSEILF